MNRPRCIYKIGPCAKAYCYKPEGCPIKKGDEINLYKEEVEALRLKDIKEMDQNSAAEKMGISQSSFQRILTTARKKLSWAILEGKTIRIEKKIKN